MRQRLSRIVRTRYLVQFLAVLGLNAHFFALRSVCMPALNCHSCPAATFACPIGVLVNFSVLKIVPLVALGILGAAAVLLGRLWCGFICPFGLLQDLLHKIPGRKLRLPRPLGYTKWVLLLVLVFALPYFWPRLGVSYCTLCPAGTLESAIPWAITGVSSPWRTMFLVRVAVLLAVLVLAVLISRSFCRMLCPLGALLSLGNRLSFLRIRQTNDACNACGQCAQHCPVDLDPVTEMNSGECVRCLNCTARCLKLGTR